MTLQAVGACGAAALHEDAGAGAAGVADQAAGALAAEAAAVADGEHEDQVAVPAMRGMETSRHRVCGVMGGRCRISPRKACSVKRGARTRARLRRRIKVNRPVHGCVVVGARPTNTRAPLAMKVN
jgi:hypothetical protein